MPIRRPRFRCAHSHQKITLKAARLMPLLAYSYCGIRWYLRTASFQSASVSGGSVAMMGFHSVIDSPEPVSRVAPPRLTISNTKPVNTNSQARTAAMLGALRAGDVIACAMAAVIEGFHRLWHAALRRSQARASATSGRPTRPCHWRARKGLRSGTLDIAGMLVVAVEGYAGQAGRGRGMLALREPLARGHPGPEPKLARELELARSRAQRIAVG